MRLSKSVGLSPKNLFVIGVAVTMLVGCEKASQPDSTIPSIPSDHSVSKIVLPKKMEQSLNAMHRAFKDAKTDVLTYMNGQETSAGDKSKSIARTRNLARRISVSSDMFLFCVKKEKDRYSYAAHQRLPARKDTALTEQTDGIILSLAKPLFDQKEGSRQVGEDSKNYYALQSYKIDNSKLVCGVAKEILWKRK